MEPIGQPQRNDYAIVKLYLTDGYGTPIRKPCPLEEGENIFKCKAIYNDGSEDFFSPYWTCPIILKNGEADFTGVLGSQKRDAVTIIASSKHQKYTELACWVFPPKKTSPTGNSEIAHDSTGFNYGSIN